MTATSAVFPASVADQDENTALLLVEPAASRPAWQAVEAVLARRTRHWRLLQTEGGGEQCQTLDYRVRLAPGVSAQDLVAEVVSHAGDDIVSARVVLTVSSRPLGRRGRPS